MARLAFSQGLHALIKFCTYLHMTAATARTSSCGLFHILCVHYSINIVSAPRSSLPPAHCVMCMCLHVSYCVPKCRNSSCA